MASLSSSSFISQDSYIKDVKPTLHTAYSDPQNRINAYFSAIHGLIARLWQRSSIYYFKNADFTNTKILDDVCAIVGIIKTDIYIYVRRFKNKECPEQNISSDIIIDRLKQWESSMFRLCYRLSEGRFQFTVGYELKLVEKRAAEATEIFRAYPDQNIHFPRKTSEEGCFNDPSDIEHGKEEFFTDRKLWHDDSKLWEGSPVNVTSTRKGPRVDIDAVSGHTVFGTVTPNKTVNATSAQLQASASHQIMDQNTSLAPMIGLLNKVGITEAPSGAAGRIVHSNDNNNTAQVRLQLVPPTVTASIPPVPEYVDYFGRDSFKVKTEEIVGSLRPSVLELYWKEGILQNAHNKRPFGNLARGRPFSGSYMSRGFPAGSPVVPTTSQKTPKGLPYSNRFKFHKELEKRTGHSGSILLFDARDKNFVRSNLGNSRKYPSMSETVVLTTSPAVSTTLSRRHGSEGFGTFTFPKLSRSSCIKNVPIAPNDDGIPQPPKSYSEHLSEHHSTLLMRTRAFEKATGISTDTLGGFGVGAKTECDYMAGLMRAKAIFDEAERRNGSEDMRVNARHFINFETSRAIGEGCPI